MKVLLTKLADTLLIFADEEAGQDLIEYALVVALIAFAATVGMGSVATGINDAFGKISSKLASAIT